MGEYNQALEYYNKDLEICEKILGKEHPDVAMSYNNIALTYFNLNEYEESIKYNNIALSIREKILGIHHPDTALSYNNIVLAYEYLKKYNIALEFYNKALKIWKKVLGNNHLNIIKVLENIESCKEKQKISYNIQEIRGDSGKQDGSNINAQNCIGEDSKPYSDN